MPRTAIFLSARHRATTSPSCAMPITMAFLRCAAFTRRAQQLPREAAAVAQVEAQVEAQVLDEVPEAPVVVALPVEPPVVASVPAVAVLVAELRLQHLRHLQHRRRR